MLLIGQARVLWRALGAGCAEVVVRCASITEALLWRKHAAGVLKDATLFSCSTHKSFSLSSRHCMQIMEEVQGLELNEQNIETTLDEIRPYLVGTGGGELACEGIDGPIVKVKITGPAANVMTVRVAVTQKLREKIPTIAAVQLV